MKTRKNFIDTNVAPSIPSEEYIVRKHKGMGILKFNPDDIYFHEIDCNVKGYNLMENYAYDLTLNATVLDHLLAHPELIPKEWEEKSIIFLGTLYSNLDNLNMMNCLVRVLYYRDSKICDGLTGLFGLFGPGFQIAFLKNNAISPQFRYWEKK